MSKYLFIVGSLANSFTVFSSRHGRATVVSKRWCFWKVKSLTLTLSFLLDRDYWISCVGFIPASVVYLTDLASWDIKWNRKLPPFFVHQVQENQTQWNLHPPLSFPPGSTWDCVDPYHVMRLNTYRWSTAVHWCLPHYNQNSRVDRAWSIVRLCKRETRKTRCQ